jgi:predicted ATPase
MDQSSKRNHLYILLDEPETSLSLRSQYLVIDLFKDTLMRNNQIIVATHNLIFMEAFPDSILSLEHGRYVTPAELSWRRAPVTSRKNEMTSG